MVLLSYFGRHTLQLYDSVYLSEHNQNITFLCRIPVEIQEEGDLEADRSQRVNLVPLLEEEVVLVPVQRKPSAQAYPEVDRQEEGRRPSTELQSQVVRHMPEVHYILPWMEVDEQVSRREGLVRLVLRAEGEEEIDDEHGVNDDAVVVAVVAVAVAVAVAVVVVVQEEDHPWSRLVCLAAHSYRGRH